MSARANYKPLYVGDPIVSSKPRASNVVGGAGELAEGSVLAGRGCPDGECDMGDEMIILSDTPVRFDIAPAIEVQGVVYGHMDHGGIRFWMLRYTYGDDNHPAFVVRERGQFTIVRAT